MTFSQLMLLLHDCCRTSLHVRRMKLCCEVWFDEFLSGFLPCCE